MKPLYVIHYSLFRGGSVLNRYKFFETQKELDNFLMFHPWILNNYILFKNVDKEDSECTSQEN